MHDLPSEKIAWAGIPLAFQNAETHFEAAQLLKKRRLHGLAVSHLVLCSEEAVKASMLAVYSIGLLPLLEAFRDMVAPHLAKAGVQIVTPRKYLKKILYSHTARHETAFWIFVFYWMLSNSNDSENINLSDQFETLIENFFLDQGSKKLFELAAWFEHAEMLKQRGFYVDPPTENDTWLTPTEFCLEDYDDSYLFVKTLLKIMREMATRFNSTGYTAEQSRSELLQELPRIEFESEPEVVAFAKNLGNNLERRIKQLINDSPHLTQNGNGKLTLT